MNCPTRRAMKPSMWPYLPDLLAKPVPRYTSFPTAAEFRPEICESDLNEALRSAAGSASLYLHIPYCEEICWYCGCNTGAANKRQRLASYLEALHREIALVGARLGRGSSIERIAFGGGSPNAIAPIDFVRLIDALTLHMPLARMPQWSVELDPRTLTDEWSAVLRMVGVTHASLGVQTFDPALQAAIGRVQPEAQIVRAVDKLRAAGVTSLNFDLMYGLPGQGLEALEHTLERTVSLGAERIALFGYAHVPHLIARQRRIDDTALPDQAARFAMAEFGYHYLRAQGYVAIGFDHFARPGDPLAQAATSGRLRRNFQGFTDDTADCLIGLGASAISMFPHLLVQNEKNAGRYRMSISQDRLPVALGVARNADDRLRAELIERLLCGGAAAVPGNLLAEAHLALRPFLAAGVVELDGACLRLTARGLPYARSIAAVFDPYRQHEARRFSSAV